MSAHGLVGLAFASILYIHLFFFFLAPSYHKASFTLEPGEQCPKNAQFPKIGFNSRQSIGYLWITNYRLIFFSEPSRVVCFLLNNLF